MSEEFMTEANKKTVISFVAGLLIGGLLVFIFSTPDSDKKAMESTSMADTEEVANSGSADMDNNQEEVTSTPQSVVNLEVSSIDEGSITVEDQTSGNSVALGSVVYPTNQGWIGVRDYENRQMTGLLGVARWSKEEGLSPVVVPLMRSTEAGKTYAVVFFNENGDKEFNLATDAQISGTMTTFVAK